MNSNEFPEPLELDRLKEMVNANILIIRLDTRGNIIYLNKYAQSFFGYGKNEIIGKPAFGTILPARDSTGHDLERTYIDIIQDPDHYSRHEIENMRKDGSRVWIAWINKAIFLEQGKLGEILSIGVDITARVRAEQELQKARDELEERIRERTAKLQELNISLQLEAARRITAEKHLLDTSARAQLYLDLISHDINNMNQISLGYLEMAMETIKSEGKLESDNYSMIEKPMESLRNCSRLIKTVKSLQSIETGNLPVFTLDLGPMLRDLKTEFETVEGRNVTIIVPDNICKIRANDLIKDAFRNLIGNSIKHSEGPLTIWIKTNLVTEENTSFCMVSIEDNGPGIAEEIKKEQITRLSKDDKTPGKGLGLYLVKTLVDDFNGRVSLEDRVPGDFTKGSKFIVLLPAADK